MAESLDFSNIEMLLKPFIGQAVTRFGNDSIFGPPNAPFTVTLLAVAMFERKGVDLTLGYVREPNIPARANIVIEWKWSDHREPIENLRFGGKSLGALIALAKYDSVLQSFSDSAFSYKPDVYLVTSDGKKVGAHKMILGSRSPVFDAMFTTEMKEKNANEVSLKENSHGAVEAFVQLLYARPCPSLDKHILEIIELADVYQIGSLDKIAEKNALLGALTKDNAAQILFKSSQRNQTELWKMAMHYLAENDVILETSEEWKQMKATGSKMELDADGISGVLQAMKIQKK